MFALIQRTPWQDLLLARLPALALSFMIAEMFYKFHSFTLECGAFLLTWFVIDAAFTFVCDLMVDRKEAQHGTRQK